MLALEGEAAAASESMIDQVLCMQVRLERVNADEDIAEARLGFYSSVMQKQARTGKSPMIH